MGMVIAARITARITSASRQPWASMSACDSGRKMKLASAATRVRAVSAWRRCPAAGNHLASTTNAGS